MKKKESLVKTFDIIDKLVLEKKFKNKDANELNSDMGSTAIIVLIFKNIKNNKRYLISANVGDSKAFLMNIDGIEQIKEDDNCQNKVEVKWIKASGGMILQKRVFGVLMITRSIGDNKIKIIME